MSETRKLAAMLAADVVGYSRLAGADEDRTLARLRALRSDLIDPTIAVHRGRVVKRTGDGILVEFRSVVDAVRCAIEMQNGMVERNAGLPQERRIEFRVGVHLGDVVEESDGDLMGDGVNIASRLEGVAKPGAICLSEDAYRQVRSRLDLIVSDLGETQLKNITEPVRIYSLQVGVPARAKSGAQAKPPAPNRLAWLAAGIAVLVLLLSGAAFLWPRVASGPVLATSPTPTAEVAIASPPPAAAPAPVPAPVVRPAPAVARESPTAATAPMPVAAPAQPSPNPRDNPVEVNPPLSVARPPVAPDPIPVPAPLPAPIAAAAASLSPASPPGVPTDLSARNVNATASPAVSQASIAVPPPAANDAVKPAAGEKTAQEPSPIDKAVTEGVALAAPDRAAELKAEIARLERQTAQARADALAEQQRLLEAKRAVNPPEEQKVAVAAPEATRLDPSILSPEQVALVAPIQSELRRLGCYSGADADWDAAGLKRGVAKYAATVKLPSPPDAPSVALLEDLKGRHDRVCPLECAAGEVDVAGRCAARSCGRGEYLSPTGNCVVVARPRPTAHYYRGPPPSGAPTFGDGAWRAIHNGHLILN
jgi:class 3 adenylate cyclase